ncbi:hypothetical protein ACJ41O_002085 [Fusarium nematophilum]
MHRHAFRSVCSRTRPELEQASDALRNCIRQFSTTQLQAADANGPNKGTPKAPLARDRSQSRPGAGQAGAPKVLDVRSLPLRGRGGGGGRGGGRGGLRGRGGFRGRGGMTGRGGSPAGPPRSSSPARFGGPTRGGRGGRGGGGLRGRGRGRGGKREGRRRDDEDGKGRKRQDEFSGMDPDEQFFDDTMRFGVPTEYAPSLTIDAIADFAPAVPTTATGKSSTVLQNLSVLGTADHVGAPQAFQAKHYASEIEAGGVRFFADVEAKHAAEKHLQEKTPQAEGGAENSGATISDAEEAVRTVITQRAINGQHETPKFATDPVGLSRSWHLRAETYSTNDVNSFEKKLTSLLVKKGANTGKGEKQARA